MLEIGSWRGGMLWWLQQTLDPDLLVSLDLNHDGLRPVNTRLVFGDSHSPAVYDQVAALAPYDLVFVDGDHSYAGVARDWDLYGPLVRRPGLVAFHDIVVHPPEARCEVDRLWQALVELHETRSLVEPGGIEGCGIGVVLL